MSSLSACNSRSPFRGDAHYRLLKDALKQVAQEENVPLIKRYEAMQHIDQTRANCR